MSDTLGYKGARELAAKIIDFWYRQGYDVKVDVVQDSGYGIMTWVVRSDMIGGTPQRRRV